MRTDRRDERLAEILESALGDLHPVPDTDRVIRRGTKRRVMRSMASLATVAVFVGATIWAASVVRSGDPEPPSVSGATDDEMTTFHDEVDRFTVTYPSDWIVSDEAVNTWLSSPVEILALATYPLRPGGEAVNDAQVPSNAIEDLGPNDVFIWLLDAGDDESFPPRPGGFEPSEPCQGDDWDQLCPEPEGRGPLDIEGIRSWWLGFHDAGRGFYVFVGMGEDVYADPARAAQAWDVLDSLRFLPR